MLFSRCRNSLLISGLGSLWRTMQIKPLIFQIFFLVVEYKSMFTSWQLLFAMLTSLSVFLKELEVWGFFFMGFINYFPLPGAVASEGWSGRCAAVPWAGGDCPLPGWLWLWRKWPLTSFLIRIYPVLNFLWDIIWYLYVCCGSSRRLWMTVFTIWIRMTLRSCVLCGFGSVFLNIWDHIRKVSWKDSFYPQKESEALNAVEQH